MKMSLTLVRLALIQSAVVFLLSHHSVCQQPFEGTIETTNMTIDEYGTPQQFTMVMHIKQDMIAIRNSKIGNTPASTIIYRGDSHVVWMLDEENKSYFEIRQDDSVRQIQSSEADISTVSHTGRKRKVAGHMCDQIIIKGNEQETELWATKSLGHLYDTITKALGGESYGKGWEGRIMQLGYYPLIAATRVGGKVLESQEVTKIEKKPLARELFDLPAGFRKQSATDLMK